MIWGPAAQYQNQNIIILIYSKLFWYSLWCWPISCSLGSLCLNTALDRISKTLEIGTMRQRLPRAELTPLPSMWKAAWFWSPRTSNACALFCLHCLHTCLRLCLAPALLNFCFIPISVDLLIYDLWCSNVVFGRPNSEYKQGVRDIVTQISWKILY